MDEKIKLFKELSEKIKKVEVIINKKDSQAKENIQKLFYEWTKHIIEMRFRQEYETIKSFLILVEFRAEPPYGEIRITLSILSFCIPFTVYFIVVSIFAAPMLPPTRETFPKPFFSK